MNRSPIEWTDFTSNPLQYRDKGGNVVWGCVHASPGCMKCYSEALAHRYGRGGKFDTSTMAGLTPFISEKEIHSILTYKPAAGKYCFLGDMTDIFGEWVPFDLIDQIFAAMAWRPDVTFQVLTKRAGRALEYIGTPRFRGFRKPMNWPLTNVHLGVSVENQEYADKRIPLLLQTPAAVRFVSYEPALSAVSFDTYPGPLRCDGCGYTAKDKAAQMDHRLCKRQTATLDWIIVGGESGSGARPFNIQWARDVVRQCREAGVACFVKQLGANAQERNDRIADVWYYADGSDMDTEAIDADSYRYQGSPVRLKLKSHKGADPLEWPEDLRVRQYPEVRA